MIKGKYKCNHRWGETVIDVRETKRTFVFTLMTSEVWIEPPLDDFFKNGKATIKKSGSEHAIRIGWNEERFWIYPFRVGPVFEFDKISTV